MYCLFNGEYGEHDLSYVPGLSTPGGVLDRQKEQYEHYKGVVVGDFTCVEVEYDWGKRDQRWKIKCNRCGEESYLYHAQDWRRGKGRKITCDCRKAAKANEHAKEVEERAEQRKAEQRIKLQQTKEKYIGKVFYGWEITDCISKTMCTVKCVSCGRVLAGPKNISRLVNGEEAKCKHPTDYSGEEWIGKRIGHLTVTGREGKYFIYKCDCGNERISSPSLAFKLKAITNCGRSDCPYMDDVHKGVATTKEIGQQYEHDILSRLLMRGYNAKTTGGTGDYGVDILVDCDDGSRMAIQCKYHKSIVGVEAVQAVYAGGRFYDCAKFAVVSNSGFSNNAIIMARKLGVYLSDGNFEYPKDIEKYCSTLLPVYRGVEKNKVYYEIDGEKHTIGDWCAIYGKTVYYVKTQMKNGVSIEVALKYPASERPCEKKYTVNGFTGTKKELCKQFGISQQLLSYRLSNGMEIDQALTLPKQKGGRPKKVVAA